MVTVIPGVRVARWLVAASFAALLAACGGGASTEQNPVTSGGTPQSYSGPPPSTADVQSFKVNLWDNLKATNRCGSCHVAGKQSPEFARQDDINLAYSAANTVVNLSSPQDSRMVAKVGGGHNCWLASDSACADILTTWISNWAGATQAGGSGGVVLEAPVIKDPGASKAFPSDPALFS